MEKSLTPAVPLPEAAHLYDALSLIEATRNRITALTYEPALPRAAEVAAVRIATVLDAASRALARALIVAEVYGDDASVEPARNAYSRMAGEGGDDGRSV